MRRLLRGCAAAAVVAAVVATPAASAHAGWTSFSVVAEADGLSVGAFVPGGPVNDRVMDGGAPRAQALLDSLGTSTAYAAAPWPGELIANATGLASGPTGLPLPTYPLIASSTHPTTDRDEEVYGPVALSAASDALSSSSRGQVSSSGVGSLDSTASALQRPDGTLVAQARSVVAGLVVGPVVLGRVESVATVTRAADGRLARQSVTTVDGARIGTQAVELTKGGISVLGIGVPVGPGHPALAPLAAQGVVITWVAAVETPDGVVSPGIEITVNRAVSLTGQGSSTLRYTVGRASARVAVGGSFRRAPAIAPAPAPSPAGAFFGLPAPAGAVVVAPVPQPAAQPAPQPVAAPRPTAPRAGLVAVSRRAEVWPTFYLPLVLAGLLLVVGAASVRQWGVRGVWAS